MKEQPDFTKLFFEHFHPTPRKVEYEIRQGVLGFHDLIFLSSLVHDARFQKRNVIYKNKRLAIPLERDCWEIPAVQKEGHNELYITNSRLMIFPVEQIEWSFSHELNFNVNTELWINHVWCDFHWTWSASAEESIPMYIYGVDWKCHLLVNEVDLKIKLHDIEIPYLYSQRKRAKIKPGSNHKQ
jgi:hypothetical protein